MSLQAVDEIVDQAPIPHQPVIVVGQSLPLLSGIKWKPVEEMPEQNFSKHIQFAAALTQAALQKGRNYFFLDEGELVIKEIFPHHPRTRIDARHELDTLVKKGLAVHSAGLTYTIRPEQIAERLLLYTQ